MACMNSGLQTDDSDGSPKNPMRDVTSRKDRNRDTISIKDRSKLLLESGNRCAIPECRKELLSDKTSNDDKSIIAELAHIRGKSPGGPRYDKNMTDKERDAYPNRILVCGNCHKVIDDQLNTYTTEKLCKIKDDHEIWVDESTINEAPNVTFEELDAVIMHLVYSPAITTDSYELMPPKEKINRNKLSANTEMMIVAGLVNAKEVERFISDSPVNHLGDQLKQGFVIEYDRLRSEGFKGDYLFDELRDFASGSSTDFKKQAAGLAVLTYLFEKCEVFER